MLALQQSDSWPAAIYEVMLFIQLALFPLFKQSKALRNARVLTR